MLPGMQLISHFTRFTGFAGFAGLSLAAIVVLSACPGGGGETGASASGSTGAATTGGSETTGATGSSTTGATGSTGSTGPATTGATGTTNPTSGETGGSSSGGPGTSSGGTTGGIGGGPCMVDADCMLHDDCCACYGVPVGPDEPLCDLACDQSMCASIGIDQAVCRFGVCATEKVQCSGEVACDSLPPDCPPGTLPGIQGACWSGACVPALSCDAVPDCSACPDGTMCVEFVSLKPSVTCEPIPAACAGPPNCECAGLGVACVDEYTICNDGDQGQVVCVCPTC